MEIVGGIGFMNEDNGINVWVFGLEVGVGIGTPPSVKKFVLETESGFKKGSNYAVGLGMVFVEDAGRNTCMKEPPIS